MPNREQRFNIYERIFKFIVEVLKLLNKLPKNYSNQIITAQLTRSATSMGANSEKADGTNSKKDFLHCFTTVRKEGKETVYWLRLLHNLNPSHKEILLALSEGSEIVAIISTIIKNTLKGTSQNK